MTENRTAAKKTREFCYEGKIWTMLQKNTTNKNHLSLKRKIERKVEKKKGKNWDSTHSAY